MAKAASTANITLSTNEKLGLISTLSTMLNAGIPILETIESLLDDAKGNTKKVLEAVKEDLMQGKALYSSFARFPRVFDKVSVNIIKASEEAGTLDVVLKDLRLQTQKDQEFIDKVRSALAYPMIIFIVFLLVMLMILIVVIPKIATVFKSLRVTLPLPTQILIFMSDAITKNPIAVVLILAAVVTGVVVFYKMKRALVLHMLFSLPLISTLIKQIDLTRFARSMYLLLSSGITISSALELAEEVVMRADIAQSVNLAHETIMSGRKLSEAFKKRKKIFPGIIVKIIEAGEKTGTLDKSMSDIAEYMDYQVTSTLKTVTTLLEPMMLVAVGVLVGGMMMSIIAPIYGLISQVGGR